MSSARRLIFLLASFLGVFFLLHWSLEIGNWKLEIPPVSAVEGTLNVTATTASYSGTMTQAGNQPIRTAFGPLRLDYKSGPNSWTTGFLMREGDGNISIGANITSADFYSTSKLRVLGIVESTNGGFKFPDGTTQTSAAAGNVSGWTDGGTNVYTTTSSDSVGIGTTGPGQKLDISNGSIRINGNYGAVASGAAPIFSGAGSSPNAGNLTFGDNSGWKYHIGTNVASTFTPRVTFLDTGNVGIGTTGPVAKLQVTGSGTGSMVVGGECTGNYTSLSLNGGTPGTCGTTYNFLSSPTDTSLYINRPSGATMNFRINNTDQMTLTAGGNLGIGSTVPGAKLEVAGNINSSTGALQTAGVTRIANDGVGTFAAGTTIGGSAVTAAVVDKTLASGRLTLTSGMPVTTADVTAATTVYYTPYDGDVISLYDGSSTWTTLTFSELSLALTNYTANTNYDIWAYNNSGTVALESTAWTNDTTRATALAYQNGVLVKSGTTSRRYLGTLRITGTTGQTEDSTSKRFVWNYFNRDKRDMKALINTVSFTTSSGSFVSANGDTTPGSGRVDFVIGWQEARVEFYWGLAVDNTASNWAIVGLDLDGTSANDALQTIAAAQDGTTRATSSVKYESKPPVGYHYLQKVVRTNGANTSTFFPNNIVSSYATGYVEG